MITQKTFFLTLSLFCGSLLLFSCGKKLPDDRKALEGIWQNDEVYMNITKDGGFKYKRVSKEETVSIDTWISDYSDKGFSVNLIFGSTDFIINKMPFYNAETNTTQMIVDGRTLTKSTNW